MVTRENPANDQLTPTINSFRRLYRVQRHLEFTNTCLDERIIPKFCQISYSTIQQNKLILADINKIQKKKLIAAQLENKEKYTKYEFEYQQKLNHLYSISPNIPYFKHLKFDIQRTVYQSEKHFHKKRDLKLINLKRKFLYPANKATIINNTGITIPPEVISLLQ